MIDLRQDAPDQSDVIDPEKLSEELEKLKNKPKYKLGQ